MKGEAFRGQTFQEGVRGGLRPDARTASEHLDAFSCCTPGKTPEMKRDPPGNQPGPAVRRCDRVFCTYGAAHTRLTRANQPHVAAAAQKAQDVVLATTSAGASRCFKPETSFVNADPQ